MSVLNSGWPHPEDSPILGELGPAGNSDSDSGHLPGEDPEDTSAQGPPFLDTNQAPKWPGLRTLLQQLPPQDSDCREQLKPGEYGVFAARAGAQRCWHQPCFACQACGKALINLIYFYHDGHLYCGRHHAELLRPRCPACDQLIFSRRCTEAEGRRWHENHFCCQDCAGPLGGGRYALPGGSPCCPSCFESRYSGAGSSPAWALEGRASLEETGPGRTEGRDRASLNAATISLTALAAAGGASLETQTGLLGASPEQESRAGDKAAASKGREQHRLETPHDPGEDAHCPTCSSSSDSEPEDFFLGQRIPRLWKTPGTLRPGDSDTSKKHCTIC
ncbi:prickle-like protein 4 isoform X2 [Microcebus murinus]|uniref:prickle-like protein 4 isoform X2 n=1 Tax=Microcebus murinus TaxID=30608 RepID=UPI003F6ACE8B